MGEHKSCTFRFLLVCGVSLWSSAFVSAGENLESFQFPLKVSANGRFLVDQGNRPFLVVGDTAWSLIAQLEEKDIDRYLEDRRKRGFNSIIVNLIEHKFSTAPPRTKSGLAPFENPGEFSKPNSNYFNFAHQVVQKANALGLVIWLAPAYLGFGGGDEGFFREMQAGGRTKLATYGRFVCQCFKDLPNIVWLVGGDYTPAAGDRWTVTELATSIFQEDTRHPMTVHDAPENSAAGIFSSQSWLSVNTVYSYEKTLFRAVLAEFARVPPRPFVLIESTYEGEHDSTPDQIRRQAYWSMLGGACGQFLGNNPIWHFDGPGLFPSKLSWIEALDSAGSRDMARLRSFFLAVPWNELRPETNHNVVTGGYEDGVATALTAMTPDRRLSVTYIPSTGTSTRELTINPSQFSGPITARWFNPVTASYRDGAIVEATEHGLRRIRTPGDNGPGANDWVLILETTKSN